MITVSNFNGNYDTLVVARVDVSQLSSSQDVLFEIGTEGISEITAVALDDWNTDYSNGITLNVSTAASETYTYNVYQIFRDTESMTSDKYNIFISCTLSTHVDGEVIKLDGLGLNNSALLKVLHVGKMIKNNVFVPIQINLNNCENLEEVNIEAHVDQASFTNCTSLKILKLEYGTETILGANMFANSGVTNATIPETITTIGTGAFSSCKDLYEVNIPNNVTTIMSKAFDECLGLEKVTIGSGVTSMQVDSFHKCDSITSLTIDSSNTTYSGGSETNVGICNRAATALIWGNAHTSLQLAPFTGVTEIGPMAFADSTVSSVSSSTVTSVEASAFKACTGLASLSLPNVTALRNEAFSGCTRLQSVELPSCRAFGNKVFYGCNKLATVVLGPSISIFGDNVFGNCSSLASITCSASSQSGTYQILYNSVICRSDWTLVAGCKNSDFTQMSNVVTIGSNALYGHTGLTEFGTNYMSSVTTIGTNAFYGCTKLVTVNLTTPSDSGNLLSIEDGAFFGCTALNSLNLSSVSSIGSKSFSKNTSLSRVAIYSNCTSIEEDAFEGCNNIQEVSVESGNSSYALSTLNGLNCILDTRTNTVIVGGSLRSTALQDSYNAATTFGASSYQDRAVSAGSGVATYITINVPEVKSKAFSGANISSLIINGGGSALTLGSGAFSKSNLTSLQVHRLISGAESAFEGCTELMGVSIGESHTGTTGSTVKTWGFPAELPASYFSGCTNIDFVLNPGFTLNEITFPTSIGDKAFSKSGFSVPSSSYSYSSDGIGTPTTAKAKIITTPTTIGKEAFAGCSGIAAVILSNPDDVDATAFNDCANLDVIGLTSVHAGECVAQLNDGSTLPSGIIEQHENETLNTLVLGGIRTNFQAENIYHYGPHCMHGRTGVNVNLYAVSHELFADEYAFYKSNVLSIGRYYDPGDEQHNNCLREVGESAFEGCTSLSYMNANSINKIGKNAFKGCTSLVGQEDDETGGYILQDSDADLRVADSAFEGCTAITRVQLNPTEIGSSVFEGCTSLTKADIDIAPSAINPSDTEGVFANCPELAYLNTSTSQQTVANCFIGGTTLIAGCANTNPDLIPLYVDTIGVSAFEGCTYLEEFVIPGGITTIKKNAFKGCIRLASIYIPASVTTIEDGAFSGCTSLVYVNIPGNVTSFGSGVFSGCSSLKMVNMENVSAGVYFASNGHFTFDGCSSLESVKLLEGGPRIYWIGCFRGCSKLREITVESAETIGEQCFYQCSSLQTIHIGYPDSSVTQSYPVTSIGSYAFGGCYNLKDIYIYNLASTCAIETDSLTGTGSSVTGTKTIHTTTSCPSSSAVIQAFIAAGYNHVQDL